MTIAVHRVPQHERAHAMRMRLMDATVQILVERGWAGTTTVVVSERAGVSRGAQLHHFPSKRELVIAAVDHLSGQLQEQLKAMEVTSCAPGQRSQLVLKALDEFFVSELFVAALELWVAARTDPALRESVALMERRWGRSAHQLAVDLLGVDDSDPTTRVLVQGALDMLRGLGLANMLSDDSPRRDSIIATWADLVDQHAVKTTA